GALAQFLDQGCGDLHGYPLKKVGEGRLRGRSYGRSVGLGGLGFGAIGGLPGGGGVVLGGFGGRGGLFRGSGRLGGRLGLVLCRGLFGGLGLGLGRCLLRRGLPGRGLAGRLVAVGAGLGELFLAHAGGGRGGGLALEHGVGGGAGVELHRADGVVVARDGVVDQLGVVVGVHHRD